MTSLLRLAGVLVALGLLTACSDSSTADPQEPVPQPAARNLGVHPPSTDPAISLIYSASEDSHRVRLDPTVGLRGRLFVFLPGTGAQPRNYRLILDEAAASGYHAVGVTYDNEITVNGTCALVADLDCSSDIRGEILTGLDSSALRSVNRANSLENRILRLLQHLHGRFPGDGWNQFYQADGTLRWDRMAISGHSQGGGFAAYIGKVRPLLRVGMYGSGGDYINGQLANWMTRSGATPSSRYYGFTSPADELALWTGPAGVNAGWTALGLGGLGDTLRVDGLSNFGTIRKLLTTATPRFPGLVVGPNHNVPIVDVNTPLDAQGRPTLRQVWRYVSLPD